jgi:transposase
VTARPKRPDPKQRALAASRTLHAHPEQVTDPLFAPRDFFDPRDLLQVKYEMLRRVQVEGVPVLRAAAAFGFSRQAFYAAQRAFAREGLTGLLRLRPGPRHAHKLSDDVLDFVERTRAATPTVTTASLVAQIAARFQITVHPRSLERARGRRAKKVR